MTTSRVVVDFSTTPEIEKSCKFLNISYRNLSPQYPYLEMDFFRVDKYQTHYDQVLIISGQVKNPNILELFDNHVLGGIGVFEFSCILLDKTSPKIFKHPETPLNQQECRDLISKRIKKRYFLNISNTGVGFELKKILSYLGFPPCSTCLKIAEKLNSKGLQWCEDNYHDVLTEITDNARRLGKKGSKLQEYGISKLLDIAIRRSKSNYNTSDKVTLLAAKAIVSISKDTNQKDPQ